MCIGARIISGANTLRFNLLIFLSYTLLSFGTFQLTYIKLWYCFEAFKFENSRFITAIVKKWQRATWILWNSWGFGYSFRSPLAKCYVQILHDLSTIFITHAGRVAYRCTMDASHEAYPRDQYHFNLAPDFDSSISPCVPSSKWPQNEKLFNFLFSFQKLVKYNCIKLIQANWIDTYLIDNFDDLNFFILSLASSLFMFLGRRCYSIGGLFRSKTGHSDRSVCPSVVCLSAALCIVANRCKSAR